ncbi:putative phage integrase protein [Halorhabdus tiamatea SARL4B]|uniref:Putative phage integrase protein n=1 Tax=Halorhabdus tiamatea SARL4B TaxID=1033806 RepID=U2DET8_9EURY|nr:hypothetical protein [Halorhabdus tiamatea]ERJ04612.1 putative phage integrase protein [Halorhabdus tiamatea SARL4B]
MNLDDGKTVWPSQEEVDRLLDAVDDAVTGVAMCLGVRCGLRTEEIVFLLMVVALLLVARPGFR